MNQWTAALLKTGSNREKSNMIWNMAGSFCYALSRMVLSFLVMHLAGEEQGGIFAFGFSTVGQQMFLLAYFGIRPFHITDGTVQYRFGDYLHHRYLTCAAAMLLGLIRLAVSGYQTEKAVIIFLLIGYKVIDGFADVYESEFQRNGCLYLTGKSNTFRTILSVGVFLITLTAGKNLAAACVAAVCAQAAGVYLFDVTVLRCLDGVDYSRRKGSLRELTMSTILLFVSVFLDFYIFSASKYAIEGCMADRDMAVFGAIFMTTSIINLVAGFVIRPYLTKMSFTWEMGRTRRFLKIQKRIALIIAALTVLAVGGAWLLGIPVLSLLYPNLRTGLSQCRPALGLIIFGGALNAYMNLFYYSLVIMKKQKYIFGVYGLVSLMAVLVSTPFVRWGGIFGGALAYVVLTGALMVLFGLIDLAGILEHKRKNPEQRNLE